VEESLGHDGSQGTFGGSGGRTELEGGYKPKVWRLAPKVVHPSGVEREINTFEPYKAPCTDGIYPILLQEGLKCLLGPLTKVFRASIALRHIPQVWKATKVVLIPKPGKNGHIHAKDFRPISLTSFLLKSLERLFVRFLKTGPLVKHPLAASHYAYTEGTSTETALHHLVGRAEGQLGAKEYATGALLGTEGAFDSTTNIAIKQAMIRHEIPEALVDWIEYMLAGRNLNIYHRKRTTEGTPDRGCPQGGVLSPLLWCLVVNDLLEDSQRQGFHVYSSADDIAIVAGGHLHNPQGPDGACPEDDIQMVYDLRSGG
jgi:hypothetical protein